MNDVEQYSALLAGIKTRIQTAQTRAALAVNKELVMLYWSIGTEISKRQKAEGWGTEVIEELGRDLKQSFPEMGGLSLRNLKYMKAFAEAWPEEAIVQQLVAQLPWGHNVRLLDKVNSREDRLWYVRAAIENGWSRNVLEVQIESGLCRRQGRTINNFSRTLPAPSRDAREREIETGLVDHIQKFLVELGLGFAFVGRQYLVEVAGRDYRLDLLFYHLKLRCFVVIDLKGGEFQPEFAGKMNFYLSAIDDLLKHPQDQPSIGLILCRTKTAVVVEYALRGTSTPMGIADFTHMLKLPDEFRGSLPTVEELEAELASRK